MKTTKMTNSSSILEKSNRYIKRTKCGVSFYILVALAIYLTLQNLTFWKHLIISKKDTVQIWGNSLKSSVMDSLPNFEDSNVVERYKPITCGVGTKPHRSVFYIKVHKTASTTLRSMLLVYGREYNLTICMDSTDLWGLNWPYQVDVDKLTKLKEQRCELIAEELIYSPQIGKIL